MHIIIFGFGLTAYTVGLTNFKVGKQIYSMLYCPYNWNNFLYRSLELFNQKSARINYL